MSACEDYPFIEDLACVGDRRTAALIDRHGDIVWLCLPNFDSAPLFGRVLDRWSGGGWRLGPRDRDAVGHQAYFGETAILTTRWRLPDGDLELTDAMLDPANLRTQLNPEARILLRRLRCLSGHVAASIDLRPRPDFGHPGSWRDEAPGWSLTVPAGSFGVWSSLPLAHAQGGLSRDLEMGEGDEVWVVAGLGVEPSTWDIPTARGNLAATEAWWRDSAGRITYSGKYRSAVKRAALTMHLLTFAPTGALVAAPTTSLPERIGGDRNYDYRFAWVRDVSLALAVLGLLGDLDTAERFMDWLCGLGSATLEPLQVFYRISGGLEARPVEKTGLEGYGGSLPIRIGNWAARQVQIDSLGYFADCSEIYLRQGGRWKQGYSDLLAGLAEHTAAHWREPTNGIWELEEREQYVVGKVMSWVVLDRAIKVFERCGERSPFDTWRAVMAEIYSEVMSEGWCEERGAFRQRYGSPALDASSLLISLMGFLPATHPRVISNLQALERELTVGGLVHRFDPRELPRSSSLPLGKFEGAFQPCCFWMAAAWAQAGDTAKAEAMVERILSRSRFGLLAEEMDAMDHRFLGNTPLLFSHAEFMRAALEISKAEPLAAMSLGAGMAVQKIKTTLGRHRGD